MVAEVKDSVGGDARWWGCCFRTEQRISVNSDGGAPTIEVSLTTGDRWWCSGGR
jgi:hypothetical protein